MVEAFALVAAVAVPIGVVAWRAGRRGVAPTLPVPPGDEPQLAFGYLMAFCGYLLGQAILAQVAQATSLPQRMASEPDHVGVWQTLTAQSAMAVLLGGLWTALIVLFVPQRSWRASVRAIGLGIGGWLVVSPVVYATLGLAEWASSKVGIVPEEHPLVKVVAAADAGQAVALFAAVGLAVPFAEEVIFRGLLLGWITRRTEWSAFPVGLAVLLTAGSTTGNVRLMAGGFLLLLVAGQLLVRRRPELAAVWGTSTLFAMVHAGVWPTPVPLFLLGLALGWVTIRSGGVLAGTVLHGLFNAVSLVYLVRG